MFTIHSTDDMPEIIQNHEDLLVELGSVSNCSMESMFKQIAEGSIKMCSYKVDDKIVCLVLLMAVIEYFDQDPTLRIAAMAGELAPHLDDMHFAFVQIMEMYECSDISIFGRPGFVKMLKGLDYTTEAVKLNWRPEGQALRVPTDPLDAVLAELKRTT